MAENEFLHKEIEESARERKPLAVVITLRALSGFPRTNEGIDEEACVCVREVCPLKRTFRGERGVISAPSGIGIPRWDFHEFYSRGTIWVITRRSWQLSLSLKYFLCEL